MNEPLAAPMARLLMAPQTPALRPIESGFAKTTEARGGLTVTWARHQDEVRLAQRLRFEVFAGEMGARLPVTSCLATTSISLTISASTCWCANVLTARSSAPTAC
jgi:hypothetical protein